MALTKKELSLTITLNELYNTHELILKHLDDVVSLVFFFFLFSSFFFFLSSFFHFLFLNLFFFLLHNEVPWG